jgi:hypothetical protein
MGLFLKIRKCETIPYNYIVTGLNVHHQSSIAANPDETQSKIPLKINSLAVLTDISSLLHPILKASPG